MLAIGLCVVELHLLVTKVGSDSRSQLRYGILLFRYKRQWLAAPLSVKDCPQQKHSQIGRIAKLSQRLARAPHSERFSLIELTGAPDQSSYDMT